MTTERAPTKEELLDALRRSGEEAVQLLRAHPEERYGEGRYEHGWNAHQILAHIASIEWTYPRLLDIAREAPAGARRAETAPAGGTRGADTAESRNLPTRPAQGGIDSYNERQVAKRGDVPVAELIAEFERNRANTIAAVEQVDEELLDRPIRSAGGITGTLAGVLHATAVQHVLAHVGDIVGERLVERRG